jgi:hypothetical protein
VALHDHALLEAPVLRGRNVERGDLRYGEPEIERSSGSLSLTVELNPDILVSVTVTSNPIIQRHAIEL